MKHECNPWCSGEVHAILYRVRGGDGQYERAQIGGEALLAALGMIAAGAGAAPTIMPIPAGVFDPYAAVAAVQWAVKA